MARTPPNESLIEAIVHAFARDTTAQNPNAGFVTLEVLSVKHLDGPDYCSSLVGKTIRAYASMRDSRFTVTPTRFQGKIEYIADERGQMYFLRQ